ncbi:hypothetical protein D9V37_17915 [Nocardioides mangrovicus]|uniref:Peptidoglycan recognition protein family domain-containing protein n=1 Tax=Nocardioides mangrovicus TaxID=2478913 RepID=A0A3L8P082_9ACTN|nr:N-acetylmuramoyl-L-alanine amidase [Nocardioides mangrovicus]RLV47979.1 hypothetical protein D9V37_17915 [Nocardioides mangrovicus]
MRLFPRTSLFAACATLLALGLAGPAALSASASPTPEKTVAKHAKKKNRGATVNQVKVPVLPAALRAAGGMQPDKPQPYAKLTSVGTRDYGMVGVTWRKRTGNAQTKVWVRTQTNHRWSRWTRLDVDDDGNGGTRWGTEGLWIGHADGVSAVVKTVGGRAPRDIRIVLVNPGAGPAVAKLPSTLKHGTVTGATGARGSSVSFASATSLTGALAADPATATAKKKSPASASSPYYTAQPTIITRAQWGAQANKPCDSPQVSSRTLGVVIHHTAGSNSYTAAQSAAIMRATQAYHMNGRGWCDIGYNYLVDRYGQIFEGRNGGVDQMVRGAHAGNFDVNTYAAGISMMGNFQVAKPPAALRKAVIRLVGWRLGTFYLSPRGKYKLDGHTFNRIEGHRDVYLSGLRPATSTDCPGKYAYAWLNGKYGLRYQVARYLAHYNTPPKRKMLALGTAVTGAVYMGEYRTAGGRKVIMDNGEILSKPGLGPARWVTGAIRTKYDAAGAEGSVFGFPTADATTTGTVTTQTFEHGSIAFDSATGVYTTNPVV